MSHKNLQSNVSISVIIPTCNRLEYLKAALQSLAEQTYSRFETVVVNDGKASDEFTIVIDTFPELSCKVIQNDRNLGVSASRNKGVRCATSNYVLFLDDDDTLPMDSIKILKKEMEKYSHISSICGVNGSVQFFITNKDNEMVPTQLMVPYSTEVDIVVNTGKGLERKSCLEEVGLFDENLRTSEDTDLNFRLFAKYKKMSIPDVVYMARRHSGKSLHNSPGNTADYLKVLQRHESIFSRYPKRITSIVWRTLAINLMLENKMKSGRIFLLRSILQDPTHFKSYIVLIASLFGSKTIILLHNLYVYSG